MKENDIQDAVGSLVRYAKRGTCAQNMLVVPEVGDAWSEFSTRVNAHRKDMRDIAGVLCLCSCCNTEFLAMLLPCDGCHINTTVKPDQHGAHICVPQQEINVHATVQSSLSTPWHVRPQHQTR